MELLEKLSVPLKELGVSTRLLSFNEKIDHQKTWRKVFASNLQEKRIDWHAFSYNLTPHLEGFDAINKFNAQPVKNYFIISSNDKLTGLACEGNKVLSYSDLLIIRNKNPSFYDVYISHKNLKWTFVITHEEDFGPYFSSLK